MNFIKKAAAALLTISLTALSGCAGGNTAWVFKNGAREISAGLYIIFEISAFSQAEQTVYEENMNNPDYVMPSAKDFLKLTLEEQVVSDWVISKTQSLIREYFAVLDKFDSLGLALSEDDISSMESSITSMMSQNGEFYGKNGVSENSLRDYYTYMMKVDKLFDALYSEGGEFGVPEEEVRTYFSNNYAKIDIMLMTKPNTIPEGQTITLEELTAEVQTAANSYLERMKTGGETIEALAYEWALMTSSAEEQATLTMPEKGQLSLIVSESMRSNYGDALVDAVMAAPVDTPTLVEDTGYFAIFIRRDILADTTVLDSYRYNILGEMKYEEYIEKLTEWGTSIQMESNQAALKRYTPDKLQLEEDTSASAAA